MTKVFVHGNPETQAVWDDLHAELRSRGVKDLVTLSPPGFGAPVPSGWGGTRIEYRDWLLAELAKIDGDIDLVGHDWGAGHVFGALAESPRNIRTWSADCAGLMHPEYVWHDAALGWQTPGVGEEMVKGLTSRSPAEFAAVMGPLGMGEVIATKIAQGLSEATGSCVLALYRSAAQPAMRELGDAFRKAAPPRGMVIIAENDHFVGTRDMHMEVASWTGATEAHIAAAGHWWMVEKPREAADLLLSHWAA